MRCQKPKDRTWRQRFVVWCLFNLFLVNGTLWETQDIALALSHLTGTLTVFAAASLTESFTEIGTQFEALHPGLHILFNFAGSQTLRTQLEQGAYADVFASADMAQMLLAKQRGVVGKDTPVFIKNKLVVIVPRANPGNIAAFYDLASPGYTLVLAGPHVPVGHYSRQALHQAAGDYGADFVTRVLYNLVSEEYNVKQVVTKVQLGEADAGIVYVSDITPQISQQVRMLAIPEALNQTATYPIARLKASQHPETAEAFIAYVLSEAGQTILQSYNFIPLQE